MSEIKKPHNKSLSQVADEIEDEKEKAIKDLLILRYAKREGIELGIEQPYAYNFKPGFADLIINTLADLYLNLAIPSEIKKPKQLIDEGVLDDVIFSAAPEINRIWEAIKKIGFSPQNADSIPDEWQKVALRCFDEKPGHFKAIKRSYLEKKKLFVLGISDEENQVGCDSNQGARNFKSRLFSEIVNDCLPIKKGKWGGTYLFERCKAYKD